MPYDVVIRKGKIFDGSGGAPYVGDIALRGDIIAALGDLRGDSGKLEINADGLAVAPGFINMLSWACESLIVDGRSQSDIRQGVTLEVMGEGVSYGPLNESMKQELIDMQGDIKYDVTWTSLDEYLEHLVERGVACNVASFVGSATLRTHVMGYVDRPATPDELEAMCQLARQTLQSGAVGVSSALAYVPDSFFRTQELVALAKVAADNDCLYIAHMRGEGDRLLEGIDEMITIARESGARLEIYHIKASGWRNWHKSQTAIRKIEAAREEGLAITADIYPYTAGASGLDLTMPAWVQEGGHREWVTRLKDPTIRQRVLREMTTPSNTWENALLEVKSEDDILLVGFKNPALKPLTGKSLAEVAKIRRTSPAETIIDLVIEDDSRIGAVYFMIAEENLRTMIALPWVSLCSDAESLAPIGVFLESSTHPRAYGAFARFLGKYVREEGLVPLEQAIYRMTGFPADNLKLDRRGRLKPGYFADIVVFDPDAIRDHATYLQPHQYATGVEHVFVNGVPVLCDGEHTEALPGRVVRGPVLGEKVHYR